MCKEAVDAVLLTLLYHRGESLKVQSTLPYRLVLVFGLRGAKAFGAAAKFRNKDCVDYSHSRRDHKERMPTYVPRACKHFAITRLLPGVRFLDERSAYAGQQVLLHEV